MLTALSTWASDFLPFTVGGRETVNKADLFAGNEEFREDVYDRCAALFDMIQSEIAVIKDEDPQGLGPVTLEFLETFVNCGDPTDKMTSKVGKKVHQLVRGQFVKDPTVVQNIELHAVHNDWNLS